MREILFRGKRIDNGEWEYGQLHSIHKGGIYYETAYYILNIYGEKRLAKDQLDTETIGQYIGLKDKNGNKIFEGDIIKHLGDGGTDIVVFENGRFTSKNGGYSLSETARYNFEVIGNKFDNPELVEVEDDRLGD